MKKNSRTPQPPIPLPPRLRMDLHIHSTFSDGCMSPASLARQAAAMMLHTIAVTDHYDTEKTPSIDPDGLARYIDTLENISSQYSSNLIILKAIEIDLLDFYLKNRKLPPPVLLERLDFVLLEYAANTRDGIPLPHALALAAEVPVPCGLAHTDLGAAFPDLSPGDCVEQLRSAGLFVELNERYTRPGEPYPYYLHLDPYLGAAKDAGLKFSVGTDSHGPLTGCAVNAMMYLVRKGLETRIFTEC